MPVMMLAAMAAQSVLPRPPVTTGQLKMLREGSTCDPRPMMQIFSMQPVAFREGLKSYPAPSAG